MNEDFWQERWARGELGFHQPRVDAHLERWWPTLGLPDDARVLVPLCGKTLDLHWLAARGHEVVGVELSPLACRAFFDEAGLTPDVRDEGPFTAWRHGAITLLQGDVFALTDGAWQGAYDRAATVALPPDLRTRYAAHLAERLPTGARMLLVAFDYPQEERSGPPFSVPADEVARLYGGAFRLEHLDRVDADAQREALGLSRLAVEVWRLERR